MRILYRGTHDPMTARGTPWTTETAWAASLEMLGHEVVRNHEQIDSWATTVRQAEGCDLFLFTSTWGHATRWGRREAVASVEYLNARMPTAALHLDRWIGLSNRESQIHMSPMFKCRWVFTPDGDHDDEWARAKINHRFLPPGVYGPECVMGVPRDEYRSDVAFVGNVDYGHPEHAPIRKAMVAALAANFGDRLGLWPKSGVPGPFGLDYNDLLASTKVVVGDSWEGAKWYWSNRVFEVVGRGGFCVHPAVPGLVAMLPEGFGVSYFPPGDWDAMCDLIHWWVDHDGQRAEAIVKGQEFVAANHSYTRRMETMLDVMRAEGAFG